MGKQEANRESTDVVTRPLRADARRNVDAILEAAKRLFAEMGVDVPMRTIAAEAGVGVGTLYRHFPLRSDMIKAIIQREVDACVEYASAAAEQHPPGEALAAWAQKLVDLTATKRGLGTALHSGDAALRSLPEYVLDRLTPVLRQLLDAAAADGAIHRSVDAGEFLMALLRLASPASEGAVDEARRMVGLLVDGLRV